MKFLFLFLICFYNFLIASGVYPVYVPPDVLRYVGQKNFDEYFIPVFTNNNYEVNKVKIKKYSLLRYAVEYFPEMTRYLIAQGADVNEILECKRTLLQIACEHNSVIAVRHLINVNENSNVNYLLCCACRCGGIDLIKLLLEYGTDVNYSNRYSYRTLLSTACQYRRPLKVIGMLIDVGAEVNPNIRHTPLMSSIDNNDCETFNYLLKRGASISDDVNGVNLLLYFCEHTKQDNVSMLTAIINVGANVNCVDNRGITPLMWACARGSYEIAFKLLKSGARVDTKSKKGSTALKQINYLNINSSSTRKKLRTLLKRYGATE